MKILFHWSLALAFLSFFSFSMAGQRGSAEWLSIGIVAPETHDDFDEAQLQKVKTRLRTVLSANGLSASGSNNLILYPVLSLYDEREISTGMQLLQVVDMELSLFIKQPQEGIVFASESVKLTGSGRNRGQAINNALSQFDVRAIVWSSFISKAKQKIIRYYEDRCDQVIARADQLSKTGAMEEAISLLFNIPQEVSCYEKAAAESQRLYKEYLNQECSRIVISAKGYLARNDFASGLSILKKVDPESDCFTEAEEMIAEASREVEEDYLRRWNHYKESFADRVALEQQRISAVRDIAVAYWQSRQRQYSYWTIIK